ncbi:MAG: hypothetical protein ABI142_04685 [Bryocella sp.]
MGRLLSRAAVVLLLATGALAAGAQAPRRTRLILRDGSYQWVSQYQVKGKVVRFSSAERGSEIEEIPLALVDLAATEQWARAHAAQKNDDQRPVLSPELAQQEAARAARTPEVLPGLKLPEELSVVALDSFAGQPELVPLQQKGSGLNPETGHDVLKQEIDPGALPHDIYDLRGATADVRLHTLKPVFYLRIGNNDEADPGGSAVVVDTHGASGRATPIGGSAKSSYVLERLTARSDQRRVNSFRIPWLGERAQPNIVEVTATTLPGGLWLQLTLVAPLEPGEYALIEVLGGDALNLDVWDFGIQPDAPESVEAIQPETRKPVELERRRPE